MSITENEEKYITFSLPIKKEVANGKKENGSKKEEVANGKEEEDHSKKKEDDDNSKTKEKKPRTN